MSKINAKAGPKFSVSHLLQRKQKHEKIVALTCYDAAFARILNHTSVDLVLVGDSLGNVMLGYQNTVPVTVQDICHHSAAVARTLTSALLCADMPFLSYQVSIEQAVTNAALLVQQGGAHAVKLEGGKTIAPQVAAIVAAGIPVIGHLGFTPQSIHQIGGYKVQGRSDSQKQGMIEDALALQEAGACALVLEMVPADLAQALTKQLSIPTIGIGAGVHCDGQILVLHDVLGFDPEFEPKFLKKYLDVFTLAREAINSYCQDVKSQEYPNESQSFK